MYTTFIPFMLHENSGMILKSYTENGFFKTSSSEKKLSSEKYLKLFNIQKGQNQNQCLSPI